MVLTVNFSYRREVITPKNRVLRKTRILLVTSCSQVSGCGLAGQRMGLEREFSTDIERLDVAAMLAADGVLDRPGHRAPETGIKPS